MADKSDHKVNQILMLLDRINGLTDSQHATLLKGVDNARDQRIAERDKATFDDSAEPVQDDSDG